MSVTIQDILNLPALTGARLLTNTSGASRVVTSISVLEYASPTPVQAEITDAIHFEGNELIITSFANIANDVEAQCSNIKRFAQVGEVGLVLYYVGILMPKVDKRLVQLADKLGFVIILMPENDASLAYANVISDVMQAVFLDQMNNPVFAVEMLDEIAKMPAYQHNLATVLKMIAERLHASCALLDGNRQLIQSATWPRNRRVDWQKLPNNGVYRQPVHSDQPLGEFELVILTDNQDLDVYARSQAAAALQISLNLWGHESGELNQRELLAAIVADEPIRVRRLAEYYHVDISTMHHMWVIPQFYTDDYAVTRRKLSQLSQPFAEIALMERYEGMLVIIPKGDLDNHAWTQWGVALVDYLKDHDLAASLIRCQNVYTTTQVKNAILLIQRSAVDARMIFARKAYLSLADLRLAQEARQLIDAGADSTKAYLDEQLQPFGGSEQSELVTTLGVYLLDADASVSKCAKLMYVHRNTITYRLQQIASIIGFNIGDMPDTMTLYRLAAVIRLVHTANA